MRTSRAPPPPLARSRLGTMRESRNIQRRSGGRSVIRSRWVADHLVLIATAAIAPAPLTVLDPRHGAAAAARAEPLQRRAPARLEALVAPRPGAQIPAPRRFFVITLATLLGHVFRCTCALPSLPLAVALALRLAPIPGPFLLTVALARPHPRPLARRLPTRRAAVPLAPVPGPEPLLASLEQAPPETGTPTTPLLSPLAWTIL